MQHIRVKKKRLFYVLGTTLLQIKRRKKEFWKVVGSFTIIRWMDHILSLEALAITIWRKMLMGSRRKIKCCWTLVWFQASLHWNHWGNKISQVFCWVLQGFGNNLRKLGRWWLSWGNPGKRIRSCLKI
jgi:hypothetical protein